MLSQRAIAVEGIGFTPLLVAVRGLLWIPEEIEQRYYGGGQYRGRKEPDEQYVRDLWDWVEMRRAMSIPKFEERPKMQHIQQKNELVKRKIVQAPDMVRLALLLLFED